MEGMTPRPARARALTAALAVLLLALGLLVAGCGGSSGPKKVPFADVAIVGGQAVSRDDLQTLLDQVRATYAQNKQKFPAAGSTSYTSLQDQAVNYLVQKAEIEQGAAKLGVAVTAAQVQSAVNQLKQSSYGGSEVKFLNDLKKQGLTLVTLQDQLRFHLVEQGVVAALAKQATPSDKAAQAYYNAHKSAYITPESRDVRHILVKTKALADQIYAQLQAGGDFAALAKKYSTDTSSAKNGGKLTDVKGSFVAPFEKVAFALKDNQIGQPVKSQFGWHVIQAVGPVKPAVQQTFAQAEAAIKATLQQQSQQKLVAAWVKKTTQGFCGGKISYQAGYQPATTGCVVVKTTSTGTVTTTG